MSKPTGEKSADLKTGLAGFLLSGSDYKKIENEADKIADAIDKLAGNVNKQNKELLKIVISQALVNIDQYINSADPEVKKIVAEILHQAQRALNHKLSEISEQIKVQKKQLKDKIEEISKRPRLR